MSVPTLKDFNRLLAKAQSEIEKWERSHPHPPFKKVEYVRQLLEVMQLSSHIGAFEKSLALIIASIESEGVEVDAISPSLARARDLLRKRARFQP